MKKTMLFFGLVLAVLFMTVAASAAEAPSYVTVAQPVTNIVGDISAIRTVNSSAELSELISGEMLPATAVFTADESLAVTNDAGVAYSTVSEVISAMDYKVIPAFRVETKTAAVAVGAWLNENFADSFLVSSSAEVLFAGRAAAPLVGGVIDYTDSYSAKTELSKDDCLAIRKELYKNMATVAILPAELCKADTVQYLYDRQVGVWASISDTPDFAEIFGAINSGAIGVISDDTDGVLNAAMNLPEMTMTRLPLNIAHRGFATDGVKRNHYSGIVYSYEVGGKTIEFDVYLTAAEESDPGDGSTRELVINHDSYLSEEETKDGVYYSIASTPWSVLRNVKTVTRDSESGEILYEYNVSTLESVFRYFAGSDDGVRKNDAMLVVEIKPGSDILVVEKTWEMIKEYGLYDIVTVITFSADFVAKSREVCPEMPFAQLSRSTLIYEGNTDAAINSIKALTGAYNAIYEPCLDSTKVNIADGSARAALKRGIFMFVWGNETRRVPWYLMTGTSALTNDWITNLNSYPKNITMVGAPQTTLVSAGDSVTLGALVDTYKAIGTSVTDFTVEILEGADHVSVNGAQITFGDTVGKVTFALSYKKSVPQRVDDDGEVYPAMEYTLYSDPVTVEITNFNGSVNIEGFAIRLRDYNGLRAIFSFDENQSGVFEKQGYTLLEYGAVIVPEAKYVADGSVVNIDAESRELTTSGKKVAIWSEGGFVGKTLGTHNGIVSYCISITNYAANHGDNVYFCAYSIYTDPNGETVITLKDYGTPGYNSVNLYQLTLDMYINGAINSSNTDDVAVWNTLLTGAVTLTESDYVADGAYKTDGTTRYSGDFLFSEIPLILKGKILSTIDLTLVSDPSDDSWVVIYRGEGEMVSNYSNRSKVQIASEYTADTICPNPKLIPASEKKINTVIYDYGFTKIGTYMLYQHEGVRTVVYPTSLVSFESGTFNYTYNLNTVYEAKATGAMQKNAEGIIDVSDVNITSTNAFVRQCRGGKGIHLPENITAIEGSFHRDSSTNSKFVKIWCGDGDEPEDGVIDFTGATALVSIGDYSLQYMPKVTVMKLPDSCVSIGTGVFHNDGKTTKITTPIVEIWQAAYNEDIAAYCETNGITYCNLKGTEHIDPLSVPGDVEVGEEAVYS